MTQPSEATPASRARRSLRIRRGAIAIGMFACAAGLAYRYAVPALVEHQLRRELEARGFSNVRLHVKSVGLDHLELGGVSLGDGLELGEVSLDAGLSLLWRPRFGELTVRGARVSSAALGRFVGGSSSSGTPSGMPSGTASGARSMFDTLRLDGCAITIGDAQVTVAGTVSLRAAGPSVELKAASASLRVGRVTLHDLEAHVRETDGRVRACIAGRVASTEVEACSTLPMTRLAEIRGLDLAWEARDASGWTGTGRGRLGWSGGQVELSGGHADFKVTSHAIGATTFANASISADITGSVSELAFEVSGDARAERVELGDRRGPATLRAVHVPFELRARAGDAALRITASRPLVARAAELAIAAGGRRLVAIRPALTLRAANEPAVVLDPAGLAWSSTTLWPAEMPWRADAVRWRDAEVRRPSGTLLRLARVVRWHAAEARWSDVRIRQPRGTLDLDPSRGGHTLAWRALTGPGEMEAGRGELDVRLARGRIHVQRGQLEAVGGALSIGPFVARLDAPLQLDLVLRARSLQVARVLGATCRGHVEGTGTLDGEIAFRVDDSGWSLTRGSLQARGAGTIRVRDAGWRQRATSSVSNPADLAIPQRLAAALADFRFSRLAAVALPKGAGPDVKLTVRGRGRRVPQELDLVINLRGVAHLARRISSSR